MEFKGPTVSARVQDLDLLVELGLGIHRRLQGDKDQREEARISRAEFSLWYLTSRMGSRFLRQAESLLGSLETLEDGIRGTESAYTATGTHRGCADGVVQTLRRLAERVFSPSLSKATRSGVFRRP